MSRLHAVALAKACHPELDLPDLDDQRQTGSKSNIMNYYMYCHPQLD